MDDFESRGRTAKILNYIIIAVIVFGVLGYSFFVNPTSVGCSVEEDTIVFAGPDNTRTIAKADVTGVEYRDGFPKDYVLLEGATEEGKNLCGRCRNDELGEFEAYLRTNIDGYMIFHVGEEQILYNVESPDTTRQFCGTIRELLHL